MYSHFSLVLMVNHACNLRCRYCYTGAKFSRAMSWPVARQSIDRALASTQKHGTLELGFFGGEPLLEAELIAQCMDYARAAAQQRQVALSFNMTTNGTLNTPAAWGVMCQPELDLAISCDGLPVIHDRHRVQAEGGVGSSAQVFSAMQRLRELKKDFRIVMVIGPDTAFAMREGLRHLRDSGVRMVDCSLDLWTKWDAESMQCLEQSLTESAELWRESLPDFGVNWFNAKLLDMTKLPVRPSSRCAFGSGDLAVAPSGNLYPCERLIGEDKPGNPMRLPGHALEGDDFLMGPATPPPCFSLTCKCSNYVRSGRFDSPDALLELLDRVAMRETRRVMADCDFQTA